MNRMPVQLPVRDAAQRGVYHRLAGSVAVVAAVFCLLMALALIVMFVRDRAGSPLAAANFMLSKQPAPANADPLVKQLCDLQRQVLNNPDDDVVRKQLSQADAQMVRRHFDRRYQIHFGSWLLVGGMAMLLLALKARSQFSTTPPGVMTVFTPAADARIAVRYGQYAIAVAGGAVIAALAIFALTAAPAFPPPAAAPAVAAAAAQPSPISHERWLRNWPCFRGPYGCGLTVHATPPQGWDGASGQGILWKVPVPLPGQNSPIVWEGRIFLSGATQKEQQIFCYNAGDGKLLWQQPVAVPATDTHPFDVNDDTGYAAPTMACDGQRVYASFATGDIAGFDLDGKQLWARNLGRPESQYGHAASLAAYGNSVIVQLDQGSDGADPNCKSALLALDGASGKTLWSTRRAVPNSWASPIVIFPVTGPQIVTAARPWVNAYNPDNGKEIWSASVLDGDVAASPAFANGMVYVANDQAKLSAIRIDGHGDVTTTHVAWSAEDGMPDIPSPLATDDIVLLCKSDGGATCYDAKSGKKLWEHDFGVAFHASPVVVDKTIYLIDHQGATHVFAAAAEFKEIATYPLGEAVSASPAFVGNRVYIRGKENLYCIGGK